MIPSYNGRHLLESCLASVARCLPESVAVEVIVVDDASTDGTAAWMAEDLSGVSMRGLGGEWRVRGGGECGNCRLAWAVCPAIEQRYDGDAGVGRGGLVAICVMSG